MSTASSLPYRLRPNKAVDRELFLALLGRLAAMLKVESYRYIGLGGAFLEDFRLIHARLGIGDLVCVEIEESVHKRQVFNGPIAGIRYIHETLEDYLDSAEFEKPVIIWFDYTDPSKITDQIERFARTAGTVPPNSILRITLNAAPSSLGEPNPDEISVSIGGAAIHEWRLARFRERMGNLYPSDLVADGMKRERYGESILRALSIAVERTMLSFPERKVLWALATHYADGQPMVTGTLIVTDRDDVSLKSTLDEWCYLSRPGAPLKLDMPSLSTLERLTMESSGNPRDQMKYELPKSDMGEDPFEAFKKYYRVFPHFARVDL